MRTFTKDQIEAIKKVLADSNVRLVVAKSQIREALTVKQALAKSKWYKPPSLARLGKPYGRFMRFVEDSFDFDAATGTYHRRDK